LRRGAGCLGGGAPVSRTIYLVIQFNKKGTKI
jgi:hypothetical protein